MSNITHPAVSEQLLVRIAAGDKAALAELYAQAKIPSTALPCPSCATVSLPRT
ncbi:MAG: hypothetical protein ACLR1P_09260 [Oscillospiraceae bacterium]